MEDTYTDTDFKEIARNHMLKMNQKFEDFLEPEDFSHKYNHIPNRDTNSTNNENISTQNAYKLYYFDFFKNSEINCENYQNFDFNYIIPDSASTVKISIKISKDVLEYYGKFYQDWVEYKTYDSVFWYNAHLNKSTWENPYLLFITLLENKVNPKWIILDWEDVDHIHEKNKLQENNLKNILKIKYISEEEKFIYLDKSTKMISFQNPLIIEDVPGQDFLKKLKEESYQKSLITEPTRTPVLPETVETTVDMKLIYKSEIEDFKMMLSEKEITKYANYENEVSKLIYDTRYLNLPIELRKPVFEDYQNSIILGEKVEKTVEKRKGFDNFKLLIKKAVETGFLNISTTFGEFQEKYEHDPSLTELNQRDKEFLFNEAKLKLKKLLDERKKKSVENFKQLLKQKFNLDVIEEKTSYKDIKKVIKEQQEYKNIPSSSERKILIESFLEEMKKLKKFKNKKGINNISTEKLELNLIQEEFQSLLKEKIKSEISWEEAVRKFSLLKQWQAIPDEKLKCEIFKNFIYNLRESKKISYKKLLEEKIGMNQEINWHEAQHMLQKDERFREVSENDREIIFQDHMTYIQERITAEFSSLLNESPLITKDCAIEGPLFIDLINKLNTDTRCQRMYKHPDKRDKLIRMKIKSLKFMFEKAQREELKKNKVKSRNDTNSEWIKGNIIK